MNIKECIEKDLLRKIAPDKALSGKERAEAEYDLDKARKAFDDEDHKWAIVKCYYSMFHAAKSLLYKLGYQEKRHIAVIIVLEELNKQGKMESRYVNDFKAAMSSREDADYHYSYSKESASYDLKIAEEFLERIKKEVRK